MVSAGCNAERRYAARASIRALQAAPAPTRAARTQVRLDDYERERAGSRRGVGIIPPEERRIAVGMKRAHSLERIERDNAELRKAHAESLRSHMHELSSACPVVRVRSPSPADGQPVLAAPPELAAMIVAAPAPSHPSSTPWPMERPMVPDTHARAGSDADGGAPASGPCSAPAGDGPAEAGPSAVAVGAGGGAIA